VRNKLGLILFYKVASINRPERLAPALLLWNSVAVTAVASPPSRRDSYDVWCSCGEENKCSNTATSQTFHFACCTCQLKMGQQRWIFQIVNWSYNWGAEMEAILAKLLLPDNDVIKQVRYYKLCCGAASFLGGSGCKFWFGGSGSYPTLQQGKIFKTN
jgi:hypothetical protein